MSLSVEEANRVIAEYMYCNYLQEVSGLGGNTLSKDSFELIYSNSLDALVPVWEKLDLHCFTLYPVFNEADYNYHDGNYDGDTLAEAACLTTAQAILDLEEDK